MKQRGKDGKYIPLAGLDDRQVQAITMLVYGNMSNKQIIEKLNVPESTFYSWFKQDLFSEIYDKEYKNKFKVMTSKALKKLEELIECDNSMTALKAVEDILKGNGYLKDKIELDKNISKTIRISIDSDENDEDDDFDDEK